MVNRDAKVLAACHIMQVCLCCTCSPGSESVAFGIGVPAGGPSEPLVDDGTEGAGPSAAPPVTAQDALTAYSALILGMGN